MAEISARLKSVSPGAASQEFSLRRNQLGQLGFHVQHDGLITEVVLLFKFQEEYDSFMTEMILSGLPQSGKLELQVQFETQAGRELYYQ